jgi:uncharacterized membrane protein HdeD (DUF308 family)
MRDAVTEIRESSGALTSLGILIVFLGMIAWMSPLFSGLTIAIMIGMVMIAGGIVCTIYSFKSPSFKEGIWKFLFGGLTLIFGFILLAFPGEGLGALTIILTVFFILEGISKIVIAFKIKPNEGWGWVLISGILSLLFALIIIVKWPVSGAWAVGITVGAYLLVFGLSMISFGSSTKEAIKEIQENRPTLLETKYKMLLEAVQTNQADIASILILQAGIMAKVSEKVSKSDVDPAFVELNKELGDARKNIQEAYEVAKQTGDEVQKKAEDLWEKSKDKLGELRKKIDDATKNIDL